MRLEFPEDKIKREMKEGKISLEEGIKQLEMLVKSLKQGGKRK
jgi:hypothetical protein